jgi:hypothetical protein
MFVVRVQIRFCSHLFLINIDFLYPIAFSLNVGTDQEIHIETVMIFKAEVLYPSVLLLLIVRELWSCIHPAVESEFSESEMAEFHNSLEAHIRYVGEGIPRSVNVRSCNFLPVVQIWIGIRRIYMFLGLSDPHPDPLVIGMDPNLSIIKQKQ